MRAFFILLAASIPSALLAEENCTIRQKYSCEAAGCKTVSPAVWNVIDQAKKTYARCDPRGCDTYDAQFKVSGDFTNIEVPGRGMLAKIGANGGAFVEVVTIGSSVLTSFGTCRNKD